MPGATDCPRPPPCSRRAVLGVGALGALALAGCTSSTVPGPAPVPARAPARAPAPRRAAPRRRGRPARPAPRRRGRRLPGRRSRHRSTRRPGSGAVERRGAARTGRSSSANATPRLVKRIPAGGGAVETVGTVQGVDPGGEGGLLGLAVDAATFASTPVLYAYFTAGSDNRVVTIAMDGGRFGAQTPIITGIPKGGIHNGGRLKFGPDGFLYVTTGETGQTGTVAEPGQSRRQDPARHDVRRGRRPATRSRGRGSGPAVTGTSRASRGARTARCGPASSGRTRGTS